MTETSFASPRDMVRLGADSDGDRVAVIAGEERLTYAALAGRTERLARSLREAGVGAGVQVALTLPNSVAHVVWYFAVLQAGGVHVPLAPGAAGEARSMIEDAGVAFVVAPSAAALPGELGIPIVPCRVAEEGGTLWRIPRPPRLLDTEPWTGGGYLSRHTSSGSTGRPKHVFKSEANVAFDLGNFRTTLELGADDVFLAALPLHTLHGAKSMTAALHLGARVTILSRFHPGSVLDIARRDRATVLFASPAMIESLGTCLLRDGDADALRSLRFCGAGGARLTADVRQAFADRYGVPVRNQYGSTETYSVSVDLEDDFVEGRVGRLHRGIELRILDDDGNPAPIGAPGRVAVKSPGASAGYSNDPDASAAVFRDGWVLPGDRGTLDAHGRIHLLGRDDVINIGSLKVDPLEVARVIRDALPVRDVIVLEGERGGLPAVRALIEADPAQVTRAMVVEACRARLSAHKVPAIVEVRARFPRDASGKVLKSSIDGAPPPEAA